MTSPTGDETKSFLKRVFGGLRRPLNASGLPTRTARPDGSATLANEGPTASNETGSIGEATDRPVDTGPWCIGMQVADSFTIRGVLGRGGMGIVYLAYDDATKMNVAVKLPLGRFVDNPQARKRFAREAEVWTELIHPHIVHAFDVRDDQSTHYRPAIFMDYCDGGSLADRLSDGNRLPFLDALDIAIQICWAMDFAHDKGHIHRDLKSSNVLLIRDGRALVTDFGLVKSFEAQDLGLDPSLMTPADEELLVTVSMVGGTPEYMPPEQWAGHVSKQSDIYAFGVILYELFCGYRPFTAASRAALRLKHDHEPPPDPRRLNPEIPRALADLMISCIAKDPRQRASSFDRAVVQLADVYRQQTGDDYTSRRAKPTGLEISRADKESRASALIRLGNGCELRGDLDDAERHWKAAQAIFRELDNMAGLEATLICQALILRARGDLDGAMTLDKEAERICRQLGNLDGLQATLGNQALILRDRGVLDGAMALLKEQERICRQLGNLNSLSISLGNQALILLDRGVLDGAMALLKEAERICRQLGNLDGLQRTLGNQALILQDRGDLDRAMALLKEAERICRELGDKDSLARSLVDQAIVLSRGGSHHDALALARQAYDLAARHGYSTLAQQIKAIVDRISARVE